MLWILLEHFDNYLCFDLLDISFSKVDSSLFYFLYCRDEDDGQIDIEFEMLYYRQIREVMLSLIEKILKIK
jgi:hypothetical protein